jgi:hypothetical protein
MWCRSAVSLPCLFPVTASRMRACACDTASRLCVRTVLCRSAFSLGPAPSLHELRRSRGRLVRSLPRYLGQVRLLRRAHRRLQPRAFPTMSQLRLAGTAIEISRFPCKRLLRMPGSTTTRGRHVFLRYRRLPYCLLWDGKHQHPDLSYAAQYLACALPCERFTSVFADIQCITRGRCGSLLLHRDELPPSTFCRSPGAPVHNIKCGHFVATQYRSRWAICVVGATQQNSC